MPFDYEVSAALLAEIWRSLRAPVMPWQQAPANSAVKKCVARARRLSQESMHACVESILFHAAGNFDFAPGTRAELIQVLCSPSRPDLNGAAHPAALPEPSLPGLASFCIKLEMLGFEIDSGPVCEAAQASLRSRRKPGEAAPPDEMDAKRIEERVKKRAALRAKGRGEHTKVRTLRTHRGSIIQCYLGRDLEPVRLDVFGPKYNSVGDWMALLNADVAWSLELRDAPGYNPGTDFEAASFPRHASRI